MKLRHVTITGADDSIKPEELAPFIKKYPFVEWAILFSPSKQGQSRYPSFEWLDQLRNTIYSPDFPSMLNTNLACHICGNHTRDAINGKFAQIHPIFGEADRIQVNMMDDDFLALDFGKLRTTISSAYKNQYPNVILQTKRAFHRYEWLTLLNKEDKLKFEMLYDVSGGKGKTPRSWAKPVEGVLCGYAGGLKPDNIAEQLKKLEDVVEDKECWIDMESGVRDEHDEFCLDKVEKCLEIASKWVV